MEVLLVGKPVVPYRGVLAQKLTTNWKMRCIEDDFSRDETRTHFETADAVISIIYDQTFPLAPNLKLLQAPGAGLDRIVIDTVPPRAAICNAFGHPIPIAEYCILSMLVNAHQLFQIDKKFRAGDWIWSKAEKFPTHNEIYGKTVCVIGLGQIGTEVSKLSRALGMRVIGCSRTLKNTNPDLYESGTYADLKKFIPKSDFIVVACPLSQQTRGMIDARLLNLTKPSLILINVSRGPVVVEHDLYLALKCGKIAAAVLDAWYQYPNKDDLQPRPSQYPFHELDNVIMTPHISAWTEEMVDRRWGEIAANLDNISLSKPLINVIRNKG